MEVSPQEKRKRVIVQSAAGIAGSFTQHLLHPFDLIKVRLQSHDSGKPEQNLVPKYRSVIDSFKQIYQAEGARGFYKGVVITLLSSNVSYAIFFGAYEKIKQLLRPHTQIREIYLDMISSMGSGALGSLVMQPAFVLKTRRLLDQSSGRSTQRMATLTKEIWGQHGILGFYRGYVLSLALCLYGVMQLTTYKYLKYGLDEVYGENKTPNWIIMSIGAVSRLLTSIFLHPLTTVRTRYQQNQYLGTEPHVEKYKSIPDIFKKTWKGEGLRGFYKGIIPMTLRTMPSQGLFFLAYENTKNYMSKALDMKNIK